MVPIMERAVSSPPLSSRSPSRPGRRRRRKRHFPSDEAIREIAGQARTISGQVGIVIGVLEADGTRRVITVGDAPYDGRTLSRSARLPRSSPGFCSPRWPTVAKCAVMVAFAILGHIVVYRHLRG
jgi:hypothetical protein